MKYELAKQLKEAGFPQRIGNWSKKLIAQNIEPAYKPKLEELIKACGEDFMLTNECGQWEAWSGSLLSMVRLGESGAKYQCSGKTPREAVARLWLEINEQ